MKFQPLTMLAFAGALAVGVSACAGPRPAPSPTHGPQVLAPVTLQALSTQIGGTVRERRAGEIVQYHAVQDAITACMRATGYPAYRSPAWRDPYQGMGPELGVAHGRWLAPLRADRLGEIPPAADIRRLAMLHAPQEGNPALAGLNGAQRDAYQAVLRGCTPKVTLDRVFPSRIGGPSRPSRFYVLSEGLALLVAQAERHTIGREKATAYSACMADAGFPITDWDELVQMVLNDPRRLTIEARAAAADTRCRRPAHDAAMREVQRLLPGFVAAHADELARLRADWDALVAQAATFPEGKTYL